MLFKYSPRFLKAQHTHKAVLCSHPEIPANQALSACMVLWALLAKPFLSTTLFSLPPCKSTAALTLQPLEISSIKPYPLKKSHKL